MADSLIPAWMAAFAAMTTVGAFPGWPSTVILDPRAK